MDGLCRDLIASGHTEGDTSVVPKTDTESGLLWCSVDADDWHRVFNDRMKEVTAEDLILAAR